MEDGLSPRYQQRQERQRSYRLRVLLCLTAALLLLIAAVRLWPTSPADAHAPVYSNHAPAVELREATPTRHARRASPPPPPPPVPLYESDNTVEQEPLNLTVELAPDRSDEETPPGPASPRNGKAEASRVAAPDVSARQLRIPELNYTQAARREGIRAQIDVEVLIAPTGHVEKAHILRRVLLSSDDTQTKRTVTVLGYGLEQAALDAARQTLFRPARSGGEAVKSRKTLTLTFGPGE